MITARVNVSTSAIHARGCQVVPVVLIVRRVRALALALLLSVALVAAMSSLVHAIETGIGEITPRLAVEEGQFVLYFRCTDPSVCKEGWLRESVEMDGTRQGNAKLVSAPPEEPVGGLKFKPSGAPEVRDGGPSRPPHFMSETT